jgi:hypothetical protein
VVYALFKKGASTTAVHSLGSNSLDWYFKLINIKVLAGGSEALPIPMLNRKIETAEEEVRKWRCWMRTPNVDRSKWN